MASGKSSLPPSVRRFLDHLAMPWDRTLVVVYDAGGVILHHSPMPAPAQGLPTPDFHGRAIADLMRPPSVLGAVPPQWRALLFPEKSSPTFQCLLNTEMANQGDAAPENSMFEKGMPCFFRVNAMDGVFVSIIILAGYFAERSLGRHSLDMMAILGIGDRVEFFTNRFSGLLVQEKWGEGVFMHHLTDPERWFSLLNRNQILEKYYRELEKSSTEGWTLHFGAGESGPDQWISNPAGEWALSGKTFTSRSLHRNTFLTCTVETNQADNDVRIEFAADFTGAVTLGVVFFSNLALAGEFSRSPDLEGYNFSVVTNQYPNGDLLVRLKRLTYPVDYRRVTTREFFGETPPDLARVRLCFEKIGGIFNLYVGGRKSVTLCDTGPVAPSDHPYVGLIGGGRTRYSDLSVFLRTSRFEMSKIPPESVDLEFKRLPGVIFECRIGQMDIFFEPLKFLYCKDVTYSRSLLARLNRYVQAIDDDLHVAKRIQSHLTRLTIPATDRLDMCYHYQSSGQVGGDMLDIKDLGANQWALLIYDVSGHGIAASLISSMAKMSFDNAFKQTRSPAAVARLVNNDICAVTDPSVFLTACLCILDLDQGRLTYTRAGHCPAALFSGHGGEPGYLEKGDSVIGFQKDFDYTEHAVSVSPGDRLFLYTDGLLEARNPQKEFLGKKRMMDTVAGGQGKPLEAVRKSLLEMAEKFAGGIPFEDDVTFLLMEIKAPGGTPG